jgi:hypothetical protein
MFENLENVTKNMSAGFRDWHISEGDLRSLIKGFPKLLL